MQTRLHPGSHLVGKVVLLRCQAQSCAVQLQLLPPQQRGGVRLALLVQVCQLARHAHNLRKQFRHDYAGCRNTSADRQNNNLALLNTVREPPRCIF